MKFGKQLELLSIAEWRSYYMSYRKLKRILKRLPAGGDDDDEAAGNRVPSISVVPSFEAPAGTSTAPLIEPLLPTPELLAEVERDFFAIIEEDIVRINGQSSQLRQSIEQRVQVLEQMAAAQTMRASPVSQSYVSGFGATLLVDARELTEAYCLCAKLRSFAVLNHDGLRKIVKKWDKTVGAADKTASARQPDIKARLANEPFMCTDAAVLRQCVTRLEALAKGPEQLAELRAAAQRSVNPHAQSGSLQAATTPLLSIALAAAVGAAVALLPLNMHKHLDGAPSHTGEDIYHAQRCLAVLLGVVVLWLTEALPYFVTSLLVPVLVVVANTIPHESVPSAHPDGLVTRADTAKLVLNSMFDKTIILVLSGLVAASAVARCQLEVRLAVGLQQALGTRPRALLLALMHLGLFTSMCISNVTAPILLLSVIKPILLELPLGSNYARALLLGLAFSCNLGGMLTPISSPQNAVALEALSTVGEEIAFGTWLALALPLVEIGTFSSWMVICLLYLSPCDVKQLPPLAYTPTTLRPPQLVMLACVCATVRAAEHGSALPLRRTPTAHATTSRCTAPLPRTLATHGVVPTPAGGGVGDVCVTAAQTQPR